jgi:GT2 family glycosyltransferase
MLPDVSIIIINYNTFEFTSNCIRSVYNYTKNIEFEIIVVDNASIECDPALLLVQFPHIMLVKSDKNLGFAGGNNLGIAYATGKYILLLNSDTELVENSIKFIYDKCRLLTDLGAATIRVTYPDGRAQPVAQYFPHAGFHFLDTSRLSRVFKKYCSTKRPVLDYTKSFVADWVSGAFYFFPRKNLKQVGGKLSENFYMYVEDMEWSLLFSKAGLKNYYFSESHIIHHEGKSWGSDQDKKIKTVHVSYLRFIKMYNGIFSSYVIAILLKVSVLKRFISKRLKGS